MASCFSPDTPVLTLDGPVRIEDVQIGDTVLSHTFQWRKVLQKHVNPRGERRVFRLGFYSKGTSIEATEDHPMYAYRQGKFDWVAAGDLRLGDWVAEDGFLETEQEIRQHMVRGFLYCFRCRREDSDSHPMVARGYKWYELRCSRANVMLGSSPPFSVCVAKS